VLFEGQHIDELYVYFQILFLFFIKVDVLYIHDTLYTSVINVRVRYGQEAFTNTNRS